MYEVNLICFMYFSRNSILSVALYPNKGSSRFKHSERSTRIQTDQNMTQNPTVDNYYVQYVSEPFRNFVEDESLGWTVDPSSPRNNIKNDPLKFAMGTDLMLLSKHWNFFIIQILKLLSLNYIYTIPYVRLLWSVIFKLYKIICAFPPLYLFLIYTE